MFRRFFRSSGSKQCSRIVFSRQGNTNSLPLGIFTVNPDGSDCQQIHAGLGSASPKWSPDGKWIAFQEVPDGYVRYATNIHVMRENGTEVRQVTFHEDAVATCPAWSPDSKKLAYCVWKDRTHRIWIADIKDRASTRITFAGSKGDPVWTASNEIAFQHLRTKTHCVLHLMSSDGKNERKSQIFEEGDREPVWTRDGRRIAFVRHGTIHVMNADGSGCQRLQGPVNALEAAWSPDGNQIAYSAGQEIHVMDVRTGDIRKVIENPSGPESEEFICHVSWSPWLHG